MTLKGRSFLKLLDFTPEEIQYLIDFAIELKAKKKANIPHKLCEGKNIALLFEKDSTAPESCNKDCFYCRFSDFRKPDYIDALKETSELFEDILYNEGTTLDESLPDYSTLSKYMERRKNKLWVLQKV